MIKVTHYLRHPIPGLYSIERLHEDIAAALPADIQVRRCLSRFLSRGILRRLYDAIRARYHQGDVNHVTGDVHFLALFLDPRRTVLTIHDCVSLQRHRGVKRWLYWLFWLWLPSRRCAAIVTISESTRHQVLQAVGCSPEKVRVIHNNVSPEFRLNLRPFNSQRLRFLLIGTTPNKNLERHLAALQSLCRPVSGHPGGTVRAHLIVIGPLSPTQHAHLVQSGLSWENHSDLTRADLLHHYQDCDILLFASTYEGFGLPIVEAQAVGRPVVTSRLWSMPEVAGEGACLVDPFDINSINAGIRRIIDDPDYRDQLVRKGRENAQRFAIGRVANQYASLYREIAAQRTAA